MAVGRLLHNSATLLVIGRQLLLLTISFYTLMPGIAQTCSGNLGENLFQEGDFGSGVENIPPQDPGLAPGFRYVRQGPPDDGEYTITNNTALWSNIFQSWLRIPDNSSDPQGYMMVVNASFEPGIFYEEVITGLCENSTYLFSADLINLINPGATNSYINPDVTFLIDGLPAYSTGDVPRGRSWRTYRFEFETRPGQTSVTLALRNNAPGGRGNDLAIDNISFRACGPLAEILPNEISFACEEGAAIVLEATITGDQYDNPAIQWQQSFDEGISWVTIPGATSLTYTHTDNRSGFYYYRYLLANGLVNLQGRTCRVISNTKRLFYQPKAYEIRDTICEGLGYEVGNSSYTQSGTYIDSLVSFYGCDSIVTTKLVVLADPGISSSLLVTDPSCSYTTDGTLFATDPINGTQPYRFFLNGESLIDGLQQSGLSEGPYEYVIKDRYGCSFLDSFELVRPPRFNIELGPDLTLDLGDNANINLSSFGGNIQEVTWNPDILVECDTPCVDVLIQPRESVQFSVQASNENGCTALDSLLLRVITLRKHFFPTAFSPNGDGVNDYFTGFGVSPNVEMIEELLIVDRWGNTLFNRSNLLPNDQLSGWNGTSKGKSLGEGVYVFTARIRYFDGIVQQVSGEVTLVR